MGSTETDFKAVYAKYTISISQWKFFSLICRYELSNGQIHSEAGALAEIGEDKVQVIVVSGSYTYVGPDGITYWVNYTADENGFHPVVGTGPGGIKSGDTASLDPSVFKSLVG